MLRPVPARWFETYVPRDEAVRAVNALSGTGAVELELDPRDQHHLDTEKVQRCIAAFDAMAQHYRDHLPSAELCPLTAIANPERTAEDACRQIREWSNRLRPLLRQQERLARDCAELRALARLVQSLGSVPGLERLATPTSLLYKAAFQCPSQALPVTKLSEAVMRVAPERDFVVLAARPEQAPALEATLRGAGCRRLNVPPVLGPDASRHAAQITARLGTCRLALREVQERIQLLKEDEGILLAQADVSVLKWYVQEGAALSEGPGLCHLTGWTRAREPGVLQQVLNRAGLHAAVRFVSPPLVGAAPVSLPHPRWVQPFQMFVDMTGTPGVANIDPSAILALVVPVLFGYMFPDIGHGVLLAAAGLLLSRWQPDLLFLVPCGISSSAFGMLFGEVFGLDGLVPALWLHPLDHPMPILLVPLVLGAVLIVLSMGLAGIEAQWNDRLGRWMATDASLLALYLAALAGLMAPRAWAAVPATLIWYFAGTLAFTHQRWWEALPGALGSLLLNVFELLVNTLSFVRVGAFALAHAALSQVVWLLAAEVEQGFWYWSVLVTGNAFIMVIEGLVVFVQTTRLVTFEFFLRFLMAEGRLLKPLVRPMQLRRS